MVCHNVIYYHVVYGNGGLLAVCNVTHCQRVSSQNIRVSPYTQYPDVIKGYQVKMIRYLFDKDMHIYGTYLAIA